MTSLSSYFHGRDSACHGPVTLFFTSRRVSTARERNSIHFGIPIGLSRTTLRGESDRYVYQTCFKRATAREVPKCVAKDHETRCIPDAVALF